MPKTLTEIIQDVRQALQNNDDPDVTLIWSDSEIELAVEQALIDLSLVIPYQAIYEAEADGTKKIDLTDVDSHDADFVLGDLINVVKIEYPVGEDPEEFHNVTRFGDILTIKIESAPTDGEHIDLYCEMQHTLSDTASTLTPALEPVLVLGAAAIAASQKPMYYYQQAHEALTDIDNSNTAIGEVAARLTQAITDIASGRTEANKIPGIIATAKSTIDLMTARISQAVTDIGTGRVELAKMPAIIADAHTALDNINAQIGNADSAITLSLGSLADIDAILTSAGSAMGKVDAEVSQAVTDLDSGRPLIAAIDTAKQAASYQGYAGAGVNNAQGFISEAVGHLRRADTLHGQGNGYTANAHAHIATANTYLSEAIGYIRQGGADAETANGYLGACARELSIAGEDLNQAGGYFRQAQEEANAAASFRSQAAQELNVVGSQLSKSAGYLRLVNSRLSVSSAGRAMEAWGANRRTEFQSKLNRLVGSRTTEIYPEG